MTILVAGGIGFIGTHLCEALLKRGHEVCALDNMSTSSSDNYDYLKSKYPNKFKFVFNSVTRVDYMGLGKLEYIYHLASPASPIWYQKIPLETMMANIQGSFAVLQLALVEKCPVFFASTSEVYGDPLQHPQKEDYFGNVNCNGPRSCYDESKRCGETIFYEYHKIYGVDTKVARLFNTYGPNMALNDGRVVSNFIINAIQGNDLVINGDGYKTRSFMYVSDLVDGILKFSDSKEHGPLNLGNPVEFTILELADMVIKKTNSKSKIVFAPSLQDDPVVRKPDITKAKEMLNWSPSITLDQGLDLTIPYFYDKLKSKAI